MIIRKYKNFPIEPDYPDGLVPTGYENWHGIFVFTLGRSERLITDAAAIVVSLPPPFYDDESIAGRTSRWNTVSRDIGAPVIVRADKAVEKWIFTGSGSPIAYKFD
ncbi:hypothetical protein [Microbulbifer aestuariivivens]|uniref:hypothetical protein n=1 Tax=Microbulbifer aestuariivivens TaxID=1908308 RepID=UPI0031EA4115